jgi:hypothetical protein
MLITLSVASGLLVLAAPGFADHNSKNGEGWANMHNDIHNMRIETRESGDNEAFKDFVKYGEGAKSVNRFASEDAEPNQAAEQKGDAKMNQNKGESKAQKQNKLETKAATRDQSRSEARSRLRTDATASGRMDRGASAARSGSRRSGGKR